MYEVIKKDEFKKLGELQQKDHLIRWREKMSNVEIAEQMGTNTSYIYKLVTKFGIQREDVLKRTEIMNRAKKEKQDALNATFQDDLAAIRLMNIPNYDAFKKLNANEKVSIYDELEKKFVNYIDLLSTLWNVKKDNVYSSRYLARKTKAEFDRREESVLIEQDQIQDQMIIINPIDIIEEEKVEPPFKPLNGMTIQEEVKKIVAYAEPSYEIPAPIVVVSESPTTVSAQQAPVHETQATVPIETPIPAMYALNGQYTSSQLTEKLKKVLLLIDGESDDFKIELKLYEVKSEKQNDDRIALSHLIEQLSGLLK